MTKSMFTPLTRSALFCSKDEKRTRAVSRFLRDRQGATVVEFALVSPLFFALTFAIIEAGLYFFINSAVDAATAKAARLIRTGQVQSASTTREAFFNEVCDVVSVFGDCDKKLTVDVARFDDFADLDANQSTPVCRNSDPSLGQPDPTDMPFNPGGARDIVQVRVCYLYENFTPGIGLKLQSTGGGPKRIIASSIFRNEPF
ncbi:MAG: TadE/TadG family type IV pilus assembly protein [Pseudomonadota bacterium]